MLVQALACNEPFAFSDIRLGPRRRFTGRAALRLKGLGVDRMALDFRVQQPDGPAITHQVSSELIAAMSRWQMELVFSVAEVAEAQHQPRRFFRSRRR